MRLRLIFGTKGAEAAEIDEGDHQYVFSSNEHVQASSAFAEPLHRVEDVGAPPGLVATGDVFELRSREPELSQREKFTKTLSGAATRAPRLGFGTS